MLVKNWMSKKVITIDVNDSMTNATKKLKRGLSSFTWLIFVKKEREIYAL